MIVSLAKYCESPSHAPGSSGFGLAYFQVANDLSKVVSEMHMIIIRKLPPSST